MAMAFAATSCSDDEPTTGSTDFSPVEYPTETVTFNISNPDGDPRSRSQDATGWFGNGLDVEELQYCVYEKTTDGSIKIIVSSDDAKAPLPVMTADQHWSVALNLPAGVEWDAYFYADMWGKTNADSNTHPEWAQGRLHYMGKHSATDGADAFFGVYHSDSWDDDVDGNNTVEVILKRPFVQVNVLSNELDNPIIKNSFPKGFRVAMQYGNGAEVGIPEFYYFLEDRVEMRTSVQDSGATLKEADTTLSKVTYNGKQYDLLFMGYYLAPKNFNSPTYTGMKPSPTQLGFSFVNADNGMLANNVTVPFNKIGGTPRPNTRLIVWSDCSDGTGGFASRECKFDVTVDAGFYANGSDFEYE